MIVLIRDLIRDLIRKPIRRTIIDRNQRMSTNISHKQIQIEFLYDSFMMSKLFHILLMTIESLAKNGQKLPLCKVMHGKSPKSIHVKLNIYRKSHFSIRESGS